NTNNAALTNLAAVAADSEGNPYVTGYTTDALFPITKGAYASTCAADTRSGANYCDNTVFITKLNSTGTAYEWSTFLNPTQSNASSADSNAIVLDAKGNVYIYGDSGTGTIPAVNPVTQYPNFWYQPYAFISVLDPTGSTVLFSSQIAPSGNQVSAPASMHNGLALDSSGNMYMVGMTHATEGYSIGSTNLTAWPTTTGTYSTATTGTGPIPFFGKISPVLLTSTTTLGVSPTTATTDQSVVFNITVAGTTGSPVPTGSVDLNYTTSTNSTPTLLETVQLSDTGTGTYTTTSLDAGAYTFTAVYSGDTNYDTSTSATQTLTITAAAAATKTVAAISPSSGLVYGQAATLSATVTQTSGTGTPSGSVVFSEGSISLGTGTLNGSGVATVQAVLPAGSGAITAVYAGTSTDPGSTGTSATFTVAQAPLTVTAANATRVVGAANPTFTGTVTGVVNNDSLTASYSTTATASSPAGTYPIVPAITGTNIADYNMTLVNGTLTVTAVPPAPDFSIALTPASGSVADGSSSKVTVTITPTNGFNAATSLSCTGLPADAACSFNPASVTPNGAAATSTLTISTDGAKTAGIWPLTGSSLPSRIKWTLYALGGISFMLIGWIGFTTRKIRQQWIRYVTLLILCFAVVGGVLGCGASSAPETHPGTYAITVQATSGSTTHTATYNMTVSK
ncbi:MAG: Ig-like domain repeat protein, partial [Silvibacterium sp.]